MWGDGEMNVSSAAQRRALVAAEYENNQERTNNKTSHKYPANNPAP
jgi:hypothetical protein